MDESLYFSLTLFQSGDKLRLTSLCHLLRGKRTSSVLMFGYLHQLLPYFGIYPALESKDFERMIVTLTDNGYLNDVGDHYFAISTEGQALCEARKDAYPYLSGVDLSAVSQPYFNMLVFITQILSEMSYQNNRYLPLETNGYRQLLVKKWLKKQLLPSEELIKCFYQEWYRLLEKLPNDTYSADNVVELLTGHTQIGKTFQQLKGDRGRSHSQLYLEQQNLQHYLLATVKKNGDIFPLMNSILGIVSEFAGNHSAKESYRLFLEGNTIGEIMRQRRLKKSTVVDHLIEGLILDENRRDFSFISKENFVFLSDYLNSQSAYKDWRYADIINKNKNIDFFDFRAFQIMLSKEAMADA